MLEREVLVGNDLQGVQKGSQLVADYDVGVDEIGVEVGDVYKRQPL